jgi:hypothetical protein
MKRGRMNVVMAVACVMLLGLFVTAPNAGCAWLTDGGGDGGGAVDAGARWADAASPVADLVATEMAVYTANTGNETGGNVVREWVAAVHAGDRARAAELWFAEPALGGVRGSYLAYVTADTTLSGAFGDSVRSQIHRNISLLDSLMARDAP